MLFRTRGSVWTCEKRKKSKNHEKVREKMEQRKGSCTITHWYISDKLLYYPWKKNKFTFVFICQLLIPISLFTISNWWLEVYFFSAYPSYNIDTMTFLSLYQLTFILQRLQRYTYNYNHSHMSIHGCVECTASLSYFMHSLTRFLYKSNTFCLWESVIDLCL